jgi:hypothetical protein
MQLLKTQLILKGIITLQDWDEWKEDINFDFIEDNYFSELKESEMIQQRFGMMRDIEDYIGKYVSHQWVLKNILHQTEEEIVQMQKEIAEEGGGEEEDEE